MFSVRVPPQAGLIFRTTFEIEVEAPRSTVRVCGNAAPAALSQ